jgi:hypothetical protein
MKTNGNPHQKRALNPLSINLKMGKKFPSKDMLKSGIEKKLTPCEHLLGFNENFNLAQFSPYVEYPSRPRSVFNKKFETMEQFTPESLSWFNKRIRTVLQSVALAIALITSTVSGWGQVNYTQNWNAITTTGGWSTNWASTTSLVCEGTRAVRKNIYTTATAGAFVSPLLGTSNGALVNMSFQYKVTNWSAGTVATPATFGTIQVQYGPTATGPWTTAFTINNTNHTPSTACATRNLSFTPAAGNLYVRFNCIYGAGDYWMYFDNVNLTQAALSGCSGTPLAGTASINASSGCASTPLTLTATGITSGTGITYQWQSSPDNITWTNIAGATASTANVTPTVNTYYRIRTTCSNSGLSSNSNAVLYTVVTCCTHTLSLYDSYGDGWNGGSVNLLVNGALVGNYTLAAGFGPSNINFSAPSGGTIQIVLAAGGLYPPEMYYNLTNGSGTPMVTNFYPNTSGTYSGSGACPTPCVGTPNAGTASIGSSTGCSGVSTSLNATGVSVGTGLTYQWQSGPSATGPWSNIVGATTASASVTPTANTFYRLVSTCSSSGQTNSTNVVSYTVAGNACSCGAYCVPTNNCGFDYISNVTFAGINRSSTCDAYSVYSAPNPVVTAGTSYPISVSTGGDTEGVRAWIDYNGDGVFDNTTELVLGPVYNGTNPATYSGTVNIPVTATPGVTRMRVRCNYFSAPLDPCSAQTYGEIEDYCITIATPTPCAGTPNPGATTASTTNVSAGGTTNLGIATAQMGTGISYQWQSGPSATGPWTSIGGANASTYTASPTANTYYQCVVTCSNSGATGTSTPVLIMFDAYCAPVYTIGKTDGDLISNISISGTTFANNSGTAQVNPAYTVFTGQPNYTCNLVAANSYTVNVTVGTWGNQGIAAWIDYNDNNVFEASEKIGSTAGTIGSGTGLLPIPADHTASFTINLSCNPPLGTHRMRIRDVYAVTGPTIDPCASYTFGETEDYFITIVAGAPFTPTFTATPANPSCMNSQVTYTATAGQTNYSWVPSGVSGTDYTINSGGISTSNTITITWLTNGSKTMTMNYASPLGCASSGAVSNTTTISPNISWANLQWPANATVACGTSTNVYGQVYQASLTPAGGANAAISVQVGVSATNTDPSTWPAAAWTNANYNAQVGNNDEYVAAIGASLSPGLYYYSFRYSTNGTPCYVYGGFQGGLWNGTSNVNGALTVNGVDWANLQFPGSGSICQSGTYTVYGQAYEPGVTESAGAGAGLTVQVGVNSANTDPSTWAAGAWSNATFNSQSGNNDEFTATLSGLAPNTYYYTFRYSLGNGCYQYGGFSGTGGGIWNGTTNVSGVLTVNANPTVTALASPTTVCSGQSLTLTGGGASTYSWNQGVTNAVAFNPTASTTYTVTGTSAAGCTGTANITVNMNNITTATTLGNGDLIWHGRTSTDYATISNWSQYNGTNLVPATAAPTTTTNVIIPVNQTCVAIQPNTNANNVSAKDLTIETGATLTMNNGSLNVSGNWTQFGSFVAGTGTVTFNGSALSTISAPSGSSISFNNLEMNNTGDVQLSSPIAITGALTLTFGDLILGANNLNLANATINGGNWNSYVQTSGAGELRRNLTGTLVYPIGRSTYNPVTMTKAGAAYSFGARVVDQVTGNGQDNGTAVSIANVGRMWHITPTSGYTAAANGAVDVTLSYQFGASYYANGFLNGTGDRQFMHYGAGWENITGVPGTFTTGVDGNNYTWTTQSGVSDFSPFTVTNSTTSLPIELISFQANCNDDKQIDVSWSTASEHNTSHFVVERTRDGINWTTLGVMAAAGNSTQVLEYELVDATAQPGVNYYRLTQYDNDGAFEVFNVAAVTCGEEINSTQLVSYPNPSANSFSIALDTKEMTGTAVLNITDARGSVVYSKTVEIQHGHNIYHIADMTATPGMYYIQVSNGTTSTDIVKHSLR